MGNHFLAEGYCVDTVGLNADMIRAYEKYKEKRKGIKEHITIGK